MSVSESGSCDENTEVARKEDQASILMPGLLWVVNPLALVWMFKINKAMVVQLCEQAKNQRALAVKLCM